MTYQNAKKLHSEDEVAVKKTGCTLAVINTAVSQ